MPHSISRCAYLLILIAFVASSAAAQRDEPAPLRPKISAELQGKVDSAIDLGIEALLERQCLDGSWAHHAEVYGSGMTGLALYALMKSGLSVEHPAVVRGFQFIDRQETNLTYTRATVLLALATRGEKRDRARIEEIVEQLEDSQSANGWAYPKGPADLSNTQFAATALRAAAARGVKVSRRVWDRLVNSTLACLEPYEGGPVSGTRPQGFLYKRDHEHVTGSMTAAGVAILSICEENMRVVKAPQSQAIKRGIKWLAEHFTVDFNPAPTKQNGSSGIQYYFLYGIERVGSLRGIEKLGSFPWYQLGAEKLVALQNKDGSWGAESDTAFALLFLARATGSIGPASGSRGTGSRWAFGSDDAARDVSLRASGRQALTMWVSSFGKRALAKYGTEDDGPIPVEKVEYWLVVPGGENQLLASHAVADLAESTKRRFAVKSDLAGPRTCSVLARVYVQGQTKPIESKPLEVRIGMRERDSWAEYSTDHERNLLGEAEFEVTASTEGERQPDKAVNVTDGLIGVGWKPLPDDEAPWVQIAPSRPISVNTVLLSHAGLRGSLLGRFELIINDKPKEAISGTMVPDPREKTVIELPKTLRLRSLKVRFLDPLPANCAGLGEVELQKRR